LHLLQQQGVNFTDDCSTQGCHLAVFESVCQKLKFDH
jgi:hypothetical protein